MGLQRSAVHQLLADGSTGSERRPPGSHEDVENQRLRCIHTEKGIRRGLQARRTMTVIQARKTQDVAGLHQLQKVPVDRRKQVATVRPGQGAAGVAPDGELLRKAEPGCRYPIAHTGEFLGRRECYGHLRTVQTPIQG